MYLYIKSDALFCQEREFFLAKREHIQRYICFNTDLPSRLHIHVSAVSRVHMFCADYRAVTETQTSCSSLPIKQNCLFLAKLHQPKWLEATGFTVSKWLTLHITVLSHTRIGPQHSCTVKLQLICISQNFGSALSTWVVRCVAGSVFFLW